MTDARDRADTADPRRWDPVRARAVAWTPPPVPTLVVAPHPDDEVLLFGGLIARQRAQGVPVTVCAVTDGEAAYDTVRPAALGPRRRDEQAAALAVLGVAEPAVRLGLPDGHVEAYEDELVAALEAVGPHRLVVAPWEHDGHPDHDVCGRAARTVARRARTTIVHGIFWAWHWQPSGAFDRVALGELVLRDDERAAKQRALACHASQVADVVAPRLLGPSELEPARWPAEYVIVDGVGRG